MRIRFANLFVLLFPGLMFTGASQNSSQAVHDAGPHADFFVSPQGNDSWSGKLSLPNSTQSDGPFASFDKARASASILYRAAPSQRRKEPVVVMFRGGDYFVQSSVEFSAQDSGSERLPIVYQNYPGEGPRISGGVRVRNWTKLEGSERWQTTLPASTLYFEQMFYNGQRRLRPRLGGYLGKYYRVAATIYLSGSPNGPAPNPNCTVYMSGLGWECFDRFQYTKTDPVNANWENLNSPYPQGDIELYDFEKWDAPELRIQSIDTGSKIIYLTGPTFQQDFYHGFLVGH